MTEQVLDSDLNLTSLIERMPQPPRAPVRAWRSGDLLIDLELRRVQRGGERVVLQETPLRLLCLLLQHGGRPVSRRELHEALWPHYDWDSFERNVNTAVRKLRRAIGDDAREPRLIETLRASGYRWIGPPAQALSSVPAGSVHVPARDPVDAVGVGAIASSRSRRSWLAVAAAATLMLGALVFAVWRSSAPPQPWLVIEADGPATMPVASDDIVASLRAQLHETLVADTAPEGAGESVHVALAFRNGVATSARVSGGGASERIALSEAVFGRERLQVEIANRLPPALVKRASVALPPPAERAFADAGSLLIGATDIASVERVLGLLESVLSAAPENSGALRMYARAQRAYAVLARDATVAGERRLVARDALRRAVRADPRSAAVAADIAGQLFWTEWNSAQAADWYALARREAPQDAEVLRAGAWFALADDRIGTALDTMNAALAIAPLSVELHSDLGWFYFRTGRYDDALRQCRIALNMSARDSAAQICEERALAELGHPQQAWEAVRRHAPPWLDERSLHELDAIDAEHAYAAAMHVAARKMRESTGAGFDSACLEAIAGDRAAAEADLAVAVALSDPGLHLARVTPELARLLGLSTVRRLADAGAAPARSDGSG